MGHEKAKQSGQISCIAKCCHPRKIKTLLTYLLSKDLAPVSSKVVQRIFIINSLYFSLLYIKFTKLVRRNLFDETGPWFFNSSTAKTHTKYCKVQFIIIMTNQNYI